MSDVMVTEEQIAREVAEAARRYDVITGYRQFADLLEQHDVLPLPSTLEIRLSFYNHPDPKAALAAAARLLPGPLDKHTWEGAATGTSYFELHGHLGGVKVVLRAHRADVCERVVVGTREVVEEVPDPDGPTITQTRIVEDVEWRCGSLLAESTSDGA